MKRREVFKFESSADGWAEGPANNPPMSWDFSKGEWDVTSAEGNFYYDDFRFSWIVAGASFFEDGHTTRTTIDRTSGSYLKEFSKELPFTVDGQSHLADAVISERGTCSRSVEPEPVLPQKPRLF